MMEFTNKTKGSNRFEKIKRDFGTAIESVLFDKTADDLKLIAQFIKVGQMFLSFQYQKAGDLISL